MVTVKMLFMILCLLYLLLLENISLEEWIEILFIPKQKGEVSFL